MAVKAAVPSNVGARDDGSAVSVVWTGVTEADTFAPWAMTPEYTQRSVHISGTFGSATVVLKGSNTGANFIGLNDLQDTPISMTSEGIEQVQEGVAQYQPSASGGTSQSLTVTMLFVRPTQPRG